MADVQDAPPASEPTMEEILASIRRIISDEKDTDAPAEAEAEGVPSGDVLELTQMVQEDGSVVDLATEAPPAPEPEPIPLPPEPSFDPVIPEPEPEPQLPPRQPEVVREEKFSHIDTLISDQAANAATSALAALTNTVQIERLASSHQGLAMGNGARTLEDMVMALIKPMLREWLDQNLAKTVDRLVQKEIERISNRAKD